MRAFHALGLCCLCAVLSACSMLQPERLPRQAVSSLQGHWYSQQAGYVASLHREHLQAFSYAGNSCLQESFAFRELAYELPRFRQIDADTVELGDEGKMLRFERIRAIPDACLNIAPADPVEVLAYVIDVMREHYAFFDLHDVDWDARAARIQPLIGRDASDTQLFDAISRLLHGIEDSHLGVLAEIDGQRRIVTQRYLRTLDPLLEPRYQARPANDKDVTYRQFRRRWISDLRLQTRQAVLGDAMQERADGKLAWGIVNGVGYLQVSQFLGYDDDNTPEGERRAFAEHLDAVFNQLESADRLIVDASLSRGGFGDLAFELARRLMPDNVTTPQLVHQNYPANVGPDLLQKEYLLPNDRPGFGGPVRVLVSDATTSAAEEFLMAARMLPNVELWGVPSNGSLSDVMEKDLPNGWLMVLSNEVFLSADGKLFEGVGVPVDRTVPWFEAPDLASTYIERVRQQLETLNTISPAS